MTDTETFEPNWASPPGETIAAIMQRKGLDALALADLVGEKVELLESVLAGHARITRGLATALSESVGGTAEFWISREHHYRDDLTRRRLMVEATDREWAEEFPTKELTSLGWMPSASGDRLRALLQYFGVETIPAWRQRYSGLSAAVSFRTSPVFGSHLGAVLAWLRKGQIEAAQQSVGGLDRNKLRSLLPAMRALTRLKAPVDFVPQLTALCNSAGVALVIAPSPKGCRASGATWVEANGQAICLLSYRYLTDDQFWFTFFHEIGHLIIHKDRSLHLEDGDDVREDDETEANKFAEDTLIPPADRAVLLSEEKSHKNIIRVAQRLGISPGIVVGQLQHGGHLPRTWLNKLKRALDWDSIL